MTHYNPFSLEGKTILVTGASSGIGRAAAIECSKMGAKLVITARNEKRLTEVLYELEGHGHQMILCDLNSEVEMHNLVEKLPEMHGLINNAGFTKIMPIQFVGSNDINDVLNVNTVAPILLLKKVLKKRLIKKGSSIVFTGSLAGLGSCTVGNSIYTSSKGAISAFIRCAALELASKQIRVNAVCPAMVDTGIMQSGIVTKDQLEKDAKSFPLGRYGRPEDIAWAMIYLLSEASSWITGVNFVMDGGATLK